jgi:hypothetical protein
MLWITSLRAPLNYKYFCIKSSNFIVLLCNICKESNETFILILPLLLNISVNAAHHCVGNVINVDIARPANVQKTFKVLVMATFCAH